MQLPHTNVGLVQDAAERVRDRVSDPDWRSDAVSHATTRAAELATDAAHRSAEVGARAGELLREAAVEAAEQVHDRLALPHAKPKRHWIRNTLVATGVVAAAAYAVKRSQDLRRRPSSHRDDRQQPVVDQQPARAAEKAWAEPTAE